MLLSHYLSPLATKQLFHLNLFTVHVFPWQPLFVYLLFPGYDRIQIMISYLTSFIKIGCGYDLTSPPPDLSLTAGLLSTHCWALIHTLMGSCPHTAGLLSTHSWALVHTLLGSYPHTPGLLSTHSRALIHTLMGSYPHTAGVLSTHCWAVTCTTLPPCDHSATQTC